MFLFYLDVNNICRVNKMGRGNRENRGKQYVNFYVERVMLKACKCEYTGSGGVWKCFVLYNWFSSI